MDETAEIIELVKLLERVRRKTTDPEVLELCDRTLRRYQADSMRERGVLEQQQVTYLRPVPQSSSSGKTPWGEAGVSKATWYRRHKGKK
jgi:hypothetical protein